MTAVTKSHKFEGLSSINVLSHSPAGQSQSSGLGWILLQVPQAEIKVWSNLDSYLKALESISPRLTLGLAELLGNGKGPHFLMHSLTHDSFSLQSQQQRIKSLSHLESLLPFCHRSDFSQNLPAFADAAPIPTPSCPIILGNLPSQGPYLQSTNSLLTGSQVPGTGHCWGGPCSVCPSGLHAAVELSDHF